MEELSVETLSLVLAVLKKDTSTTSASFILHVTTDIKDNDNVNVLLQRCNSGQLSARSMFEAIATLMFVDNHINWGRIMTVIAFASLLNYNDEGEFATVVSDCVMRHVGQWMLREGGWKAFENYFGLA